MTGIENKLITLKLNRLWQVVGVSIVADALVDLCAGFNSFALDINYYIDHETRKPDFSQVISMIPTDWDTWITLPVREWDFAIHSPTLEVRVPTVLIAKNYADMPLKSPIHPSKRGVYVRDNGVDQYTGKKLSVRESSIDHIIPVSKGGKHRWDNVALTHKTINYQKGNRFNHEVGLKLLRKPIQPGPVPVSVYIDEPKHIDWNHFLLKK